jgi:hypothetical protein
MKSVLKIGVLALALGMFVASCNSGTGTNSADSTNTEIGAPSNNTQVAPVDTTAPKDTSAADSSGM